MTSCVAAVVALPWWVWVLVAAPAAFYFSFAMVFAWVVWKGIAPGLSRHIEHGL